MKRSVRAWLSIWCGNQGNARSFFWDRQQAMDHCNLVKGPNRRVVPCTVTYDDGRKPAKRKARKK